MSCREKGVVHTHLRATPTNVTIDVKIHSFWFERVFATYETVLGLVTRQNLVTLVVFVPRSK